MSNVLRLIIPDINITLVLLVFSVMVIICMTYKISFKRFHLIFISVFASILLFQVTELYIPVYLKSTGHTLEELKGSAVLAFTLVSRILDTLCSLFKAYGLYKCRTYNGVGHAIEESINEFNRLINLPESPRQYFSDILKNRNHKYYGKAISTIKTPLERQVTKIIAHVIGQLNRIRNEVDVIAVYGGGSILMKPYLVSKLVRGYISDKM